MLKVILSIVVAKACHIMRRRHILVVYCFPFKVIWNQGTGSTVVGVVGAKSGPLYAANGVRPLSQ